MSEFNATLSINGDYALPCHLGCQYLKEDTNGHSGSNPLGGVSYPMVLHNTDYLCATTYSHGLEAMQFVFTGVGNNFTMRVVSNPHQNLYVGLAANSYLAFYSSSTEFWFWKSGGIIPFEDFFNSPVSDVFIANSGGELYLYDTKVNPTSLNGNQWSAYVCAGKSGETGAKFSVNRF